MDHAREYHCNICGNTFEEFVLFEGHFTFNEKCRTLGPFMQCYICSKSFFHFAVLKYHLQSHSKNNVIQKINSTNETQGKASQSHGFDCNICNRSFRIKFHLIEHLKIHMKAASSNQINGSLKEKLQREQVVRSSDRNESSNDLKQQRMSKCYRCQVCNANCYFKGQLGNITISYPILAYIILEFLNHIHTFCGLFCHWYFF